MMKKSSIEKRMLQFFALWFLPLYYFFKTISWYPTCVLSVFHASRSKGKCKWCLNGCSNLHFNLRQNWFKKDFPLAVTFKETKHQEKHWGKKHLRQRASPLLILFSGLLLEEFNIFARKQNILIILFFFYANWQLVFFS